MDLIENPKKRTALGDCGAKRVKQLFTSEIMIDDTLKLYNDLIS
jgi:glycosyltransferase involved in cell wall biosynthesis